MNNGRAFAGVVEAAAAALMTPVNTSGKTATGFVFAKYTPTGWARARQ